MGALVVCCICLLTLLTDVGVEVSDQNASPTEAVCSGSKLLIKDASIAFQRTNSRRHLL